MSNLDTRAFIQRETPVSLQNEDLFKQRLQRAWRCDLKKLGKTYSPDYLALRNGVGCAWVELKCRLGQEWHEYDTYMLAVKKWEKCVALAQTPGLEMPFFLAVAVVDGDYWLDITKYISEGKKAIIRMGGRNDRNWAEDREPCVYIPKDEFRKLPDEF